jgi:hypothetical protein
MIRPNKICMAHGPQGGVLQYVPDYTVRDFFNNAMDRDSLCGHTVHITGFPAESFINYDDDTNYDDNDDDDDDEPLLSPHGKILCLQDFQALFITIPSRPHERASHMFGQLIYRKLMAMNFDDTLLSVRGG